MGKLNLTKYKNQFLAGIAVNLVSMAHGTMLGWMSPTFHLLSSENSPFDRDITIEEESWIGSSISIGAFIGTIIFGCLIDRIGRKYTLLLLAIPHLCGWIAIFLSNEFFHLYIARFLAGLTGGGLYIVIPIFIAEIADNSIRGSLGSMIVFVVNIGLTIGYFLASYLPYRMVPIAGMWIPIIYTLMITYLPETPRYLILSDKDDSAEMSFKFYTNFKGETKEELVKFTKSFQELKDSLRKSIEIDSKIKLKDFTNPVAIKAILIGVVLVIHNQVTGSFVILNYSAKVFATSGTTLDPNLCTIFTGVVQIIGTYFATMLVDRFGRKPLLNLSLLGMFLGLIITGVHNYFDDFIDPYQYSWIPIVSVSFVIFSAALGVNPLIIVIIVEIVPGKIRSLVSMGCMLILSAFAFTVLKIFPILLETLNLYGVMWLCAGFCLTGMLFVILVIPETRGKVLQESVDTIVEENKC